MRKHPVLSGIVGIIVLLAAYLLFWPVPIDPAPFSPPPAPGLVGPYAQNDLLAGVERLESNIEPPHEGVAIDREGRIYTGTKDGRVIRYDRDGKNPEVFVEVGRWVLGMDFDAAGNLIVGDGSNGLLSVSPEKSITVLATEEGGVPFGDVNGVDIAPDGLIYFSDTSKKFNDLQYMDDLLEHRPNGRLLAYDPATKEIRLILSDLYFPAIVAVSPDNSFLLLAEMGMYRVLRVQLSGPDSGKSEVFIDNLPGFPHGVSAGTDGIFWVTILSPRDKLADTVLFPHPFLRKMLRRLPAALMPGPKDYSFVLGLDRDGNIVYNLQDSTGAFSQITYVLEYNGMLYLGSFAESAIGRIPTPKRGPK